MLLMEIVTHTPWWVWVLFVYLVYCGVRLLSPREISRRQILLMPGIFLLWAVYGIFNKFYMPWTALLIFIAASLVGLLFGAVIAMKWWPVTLNKAKGVIQSSGSVIPLVFILINFSCLYVLNVYAAYHPASFADLQFTAVYSAASGVANGLFWGMSLANLRQAFAGRDMRSAD